MHKTTRFGLVIGLALCVAPGFAQSSFIGNMKTIKPHASTVPSNGDINPYGVAVVPANAGALHAGHVLVSNFNNSMNFQGTGTTIVQVSPGDGSISLFAQINAASLPGACPGGVGLTTALVVLRSGWVIVGSLPTTDGMSDSVQAGCLIVLNGAGKVVETFSGAGFNGPWDMTALDMGTAAALFYTNVLDGSVVRLILSIPLGGMPSISSQSVIGSGFAHHPDPAALEVGPTGVGLGADGTLYVADTVNSNIQAISNALTTGNAGIGAKVNGSGSALNAPLGLAIAPNGNILTVNGGDGNMVETTPSGVQVAVKFVDVTTAPAPGAGAGDLFGLAIEPTGQGVYFVNDGNNTLDELH